MNSKNENLDPAIKQRQRWMSVLAKASLEDLECAWLHTDKKPEFSHLRKPETGLVMVRARAGGTGKRFNFGEMTMTRCAVTLEGGHQGFGYVAGTSRRHAELAALFDAMLLDDDQRDAVEERVIGALEKTNGDACRQKATKTAATKVDFFTLVRGENE